MKTLVKFAAIAVLGCFCASNSSAMNQEYCNRDQKEGRWISLDEAKNYLEAQRKILEGYYTNLAEIRQNNLQLASECDEVTITLNQYSCNINCTDKWIDRLPSDKAIDGTFYLKDVNDSAEAAEDKMSSLRCRGTKADTGSGC